MKYILKYFEYVENKRKQLISKKEMHSMVYKLLMSADAEMVILAIRYILEDPKSWSTPFISRIFLNTTASGRPYKFYTKNGYQILFLSNSLYFSKVTSVIRTILDDIGIPVEIVEL